MPPAILPVLVLLAFASGAASGEAPGAGGEAPALDRLTGKHKQSFKLAVGPAPAKRLAAREAVAAWPRLTRDAAAELATLVAREFPFAPADGWKGSPTKAGGLRRIDVPGLGEREYWLAVPEGYPGKRNWPLAISLHGAGGNAQGDFEWCWKPWAKQWPGLVASPSGQPAGAQWFPEQEPFVMAVLDDVRRRFAIDDDRVIIHGFSNGGNGAWWYATHRPSLWSAMFTRGGGPYDRDLFANFANLPALIVHGASDSVIPAEHDRNAAGELEKLGYDVTYRELPGDHVPFHDQVNPEALPSLARRARDPYPKRVVFASAVAGDQRAYWIGFPQRGGERISIEATVDGQRIDVSAQALDAATLWLSDRLVDLDRPVVIAWNGAVVHEGVVERRAATLVDWLDATGDRAAAPVARVEIKP